MTDGDLSLLTGAPTDSSGSGRHRHRKAPKRGAARRAEHGRRRGAGSRRRRGRSLAALLVVVVMLGGLGGGIWYGGSRVLAAFQGTPDYPGTGTGTVMVQVNPGDTATDVARTLAAADVVKSPQAFVSAALADPRSRGLQPGTYKLRKQMKATAALDLLLDPASRIRSRVTLPEGLSVAQALERITRSTGIPLAELRGAAQNSTALGLPPYAGGRLEGFLYPATYDVEPGTSATAVLRMMVAKFTEVAAETEIAQRGPAVRLNPYQVVIVASLIEREARVASDGPKISRVIQNRLGRGIPLAIDATILYGLGRHSGQLTQADLEKMTPYNTRKVRGLPPTPIASPGKTAIESALTPARGDWLYYVIMDKQGHHFFTADYNAFLRQKAKSQREGLI